MGFTKRGKEKIMKPRKENDHWYKERIRGEKTEEDLIKAHYMHI